MLDDPRPHAVRSRAQRLAELAEMPHRSWRLHQVSKEAKTAAVLAKRGTLLLGAEGLDTQLHATAQDALACVAKFLRRDDGQQLIAIVARAISATAMRGCSRRHLGRQPLPDVRGLPRVASPRRNLSCFGEHALEDRDHALVQLALGALSRDALRESRIEEQLGDRKGYGLGYGMGVCSPRPRFPLARRRCGMARL